MRPVATRRHGCPTQNVHHVVYHTRCTKYHVAVHAVHTAQHKHRNLHHRPPLQGSSGYTYVL